MARMKHCYSNAAMLPYCATRWSKSLYSGLYINEYKLLLAP